MNVLWPLILVLYNLLVVVLETAALMADEDGLILNLSSFNDGEQEVRQRKTNRKLKVI